MAKYKREVRPRRYGFFFLNGKLYSTVHAEKRSNLLYAHEAETGELKTFLYSDVRKYSQRAFTIGQTAKLLGCKPRTLRTYDRSGRVRPAQRWAGPDLSHKVVMRYYSEDDVRELRQVMAETHRGRPRHDGIVFPRESLPTAAELEAKMRGDTVLYEDVGGEFVPVWRAKH